MGLPTPFLPSMSPLYKVLSPSPYWPVCHSSSPRVSPLVPGLRPAYAPPQHPPSIGPWCSLCPYPAPYETPGLSIIPCSSSPDPFTCETPINLTCGTLHKGPFPAPCRRPHCGLQTTLRACVTVCVKWPAERLPGWRRFWKAAAPFHLPRCNSRGIKLGNNSCDSRHEAPLLPLARRRS